MTIQIVRCVSPTKLYMEDGACHVASSVEAAEEMWGPGNHLVLDIPDGVFLDTLHEDLNANGMAQVDPAKQAVRDSQQADRQKMDARILAGDAIRDAIDFAKTWDQLTAIERKVISRVMPTDQELADAGYPIS